MSQPSFKFNPPSDDDADVYANHINMFWSGVDVTVVFGTLKHDLEKLSKGELNAEMQVENRGKVTMAWPVAKLLQTHLAKLVSDYESENGPLQLPGHYKIPKSSS